MQYYRWVAEDPPRKDLLSSQGYIDLLLSGELTTFLDDERRGRLAEQIEAVRHADITDGLRAMEANRHRKVRAAHG